MATLTVNIDNEKHLPVLKEFLVGLGLKFHIEADSESSYSDELKEKLDKRYQDYIDGSVSMISADDSRKRIQQILAAGRQK
ncbi:hypothetical protein BDE36_0221 [Arcticibacter tournemirensis]|uniref:Uncharacterized protein n=1 Tax=Arcticibacter tournemirensis TaxID=699437 RepID=A0A5M9GMA9_9SPHI|nr:hypothetical protein [Arcticibacter tournemirensis]KAA8474927.1 hypothetical protein F1649_21800 [Arcticibacter tournemirensis]TQM48537.1 hypothetical protein BDE36_0221 [Arcticibacter tournemirensis]